MHGDNGAETALRTADRDDVLVVGPRQTLELCLWLGRGQATHDEILWAIVSEKCSETRLGGRSGLVWDRSGLSRYLAQSPALCHSRASRPTSRMVPFLVEVSHRASSLRLTADATSRAQLGFATSPGRRARS